MSGFDRARPPIRGQQIGNMRVLLFDIDGTLLQTNGGGSDALKKAMQREFGLAEATTELDFSGRTDRSLLEEILGINELPCSADHLSRLRDCYVSLFPHVLHARGGRVLPGAIELLEHLKTVPHVVCHVMTGNLGETATHKLEHFGLRHYFAEIFGGEHDVHRNDLARRTADSIRSLHGEAAVRDMIVIGDTPADIHCGHAVGAQVLAVCTGRHQRHELERENPMSVQDDLTNLPELIRLLTEIRPATGQPNAL
jgi:phosphoglycolate phosphatase